MRLKMSRGAFVGLVLALGIGGMPTAHSSVDQVLPLDQNEDGSATQDFVSDNIEMWFVELSSAPTVDGTAESTLETEEAVFHARAAEAGVRYEKVRHFRKLWNGLTLRVTPKDAARLTGIPGVQAVYPVLAVKREQADPSGEVLDLVSALAQTGANIAQSEGFTGRGVRVAVMDTGIDYDHPDLGGCFGHGCRVRRGWDFVGDAFNADPSSPGYNPTPVPDPDPDDCNGHGTHVAGIVGAKAAAPGGITGVAPGVTFGAYRVFGCEGSTTADIMLAAMERILDDDSDVLNMSIGSSFQWPQYPTAQGADRLAKKGVVVVASIGNSGANGLYSASAPGVGKRVIGVASFDNSHVFLPTFTITPDNAVIGWQQASGSPAAPTSGTFPMARTGTATSTADGCVALPPGSLTGQVALIRRGTCGFSNKAINAQNAGAVAVVLYNNVAGRVSATVAAPPGPPTIPTVTISAAEGVLIDGRLAGGPVSMTWTANSASFPNTPNGGLISSFSSYGPAPDLSLKPDIGAPGGLIRSTVPLEQGGIGVISGTSMASPHTAGAAALLLQSWRFGHHGHGHHGHHDGDDDRHRHRGHGHDHDDDCDDDDDSRVERVRTALLNNAEPRNWWGNPALGFLDNVHRQGAGMLRVDRAIHAKTSVEPEKLALGESESGPDTRRLTIENDGWTSVTYDLSHVAALATGPNTFVPSFFNAPASVVFSSPSVTVPRHSKRRVEVNITVNPALADKSLYGGYIILTPQGGGDPRTVPYVGIKGDYQSIQAIVPTANNFPWLAKLVGTSLFNQPLGATYTMDGDDVPFILLHLDHQVRRLRMEVFDVATGDSKNFAFDIDYVGRNSTATSFFAFAWDGTTAKANGRRVREMPDGTYQIQLTILKALGDRHDPAHTETRTLPNITIDRP